MFDECILRGRRFAPARFCAPLAGYTHSAFRRLLADFGGCGAVWTEMLAAKPILKESFADSPWLRRRAMNQPLVFQLMVRCGDPLDRILGRLTEQGVEFLDLNLACDAMAIRAQEAGSALWENLDAMRSVVVDARRHWPGLLLTKIRLGSRKDNWREDFLLRLRLLEDAGVDAVTLHPRFFEDKFRRRAQHELLPWAASLTRLPLIANGDFTGADCVEAQASHLSPACAVMIGRMAIAQPWLFSSWKQPATVDYAEVWLRMLRYVTEDFPAAVALRRMQMFTKYYSANFAFRHQFYVSISNAATLHDLEARGREFFSRAPATVRTPLVAGL